MKISNSLKLYIADTSCLDDPVLFDKCLGMVSECRRAKVESYRFRKDRNLALGAGLLLQIGLAARGIGEKDAAYAFGPNGKPFLQERPEIRFNLSHSGTMAAAAFADCEVGCDIEEVTELEDDVAAMFLRSGEFENVRSITDNDARRQLLFRYWTIKESVQKATGLGAALPMDSFEIVLENGLQPIVKSLASDRWHIVEVDICRSYKCAICTDGPVGKVDVSEIDFTSPDFAMPHC